MYEGFYTQFQLDDFKIDSDEARFDWAKCQTYIPLVNMMHSAAMLEIDSCPIKGFHEDKINEILTEMALIDPSEYGISVMVAFGYRKEEPRHPKTRRDAEEVIQFV